MSYPGSNASIPLTFTANGIALAVQGRLCALLVAPTGAVTPVVTVFDNASAASGTALATVKTLSAAPIFLSWGDEGVYAANGVYVSADVFTTLTVTAYVKRG